MKHKIEINLNISAGFRNNKIFKILKDNFPYKNTVKKIKNISYINTKNNQIIILNSITNDLSFEEFEMYKANPLNIMLNQTELMKKFNKIVILTPNKFKYIAIGKNPSKNESVKIKLFPSNFPKNMSKNEMRYDNIKSNTPDSLSVKIAS